MRIYRLQMMVCLFLVVTTVAVFSQLHSHDFVNFDDDTYVTENPHVQAGLSTEGVVWAFTTAHANFWHPLTWLSYMLDCQLFGLKPGFHHLSNLLLHMVNTILLFIVLNRMSRALWCSAFVAALFALHPLHVESVAWVSERKDTLSTLFWMLTMWGYVWYVERPGVRRYLLVILLFILGLMAKPMLVTLPFVLLLLDYWPFNRFEFEQADDLVTYFSNPQKRRLALRLVWEKVPFFVIAGASSVVAFLAQQSGGAISSWDKYPVGLRVANALVSYASYIGKMIWPHHLALPYPHPGTIPVWQAAGAGLLLICISGLIVLRARRHPYLLVGWLWYLGTLVPVSGLVQVGSHAMADRYTYVPLIGLFIVISWGVSDLTPRWRYRNGALAISTGIVLSALMTTSWFQVHHWQNTMTLFKHTLNVTSNNTKAHNNLGVDLLRHGRFEEATTHFAEALRINPENATLHYNIGFALLRQEKTKEAVNWYFRAIQIDPNLMEAHKDLGTALSQLGRADEAIAHLSAAIRIQPGDRDLHNDLGNLLLNQGRFEQAIRHFMKVMKIKPDFAVHYNMGNALSGLGNASEAIKHYSESLRMKRDNALAHNNLANALASQGNLDEAVVHYSEALRLRPEFARAHYNLGVILKRQGRLKEAVDHFSEALRIKPDYSGARRNLDDALQRMGKSNEVSKSEAKP